MVNAGMFAGRHNSRGVAHTGKGLEGLGSLTGVRMPGQLLQASSGLLSKSDSCSQRWAGKRGCGVCWGQQEGDA